MLSERNKKSINFCNIRVHVGINEVFPICVKHSLLVILKSYIRSLDDTASLTVSFSFRFYEYIRHGIIHFYKFHYFISLTVMYSACFGPVHPRRYFSGPHLSPFICSSWFVFIYSARHTINCLIIKDDEEEKEEDEGNTLFDSNRSNCTLLFYSHSVIMLHFNDNKANISCIWSFIAKAIDSSKNYHHCIALKKCISKRNVNVFALILPK